MMDSPGKQGPDEAEKQLATPDRKADRYFEKVEVSLHGRRQSTSEGQGTGKKL